MERIVDDHEVFQMIEEYFVNEKVEEIDDMEDFEIKKKIETRSISQKDADSIMKKHQANDKGSYIWHLIDGNLDLITCLCSDHYLEKLASQKGHNQAIRSEVIRRWYKLTNEFRLKYRE